jgi:CarD family transcriptional regulator
MMSTVPGKPRKDHPMQFKAGDYVVHPAYGVGSVVRLEEKRLAEAEPRWYYVIDVGKGTVWVPVDSHEPLGLRSVTSHEELDQCRRLLKSKPTVLAKDHHRRRLEIGERVKQGSFRVMCEVVRDLSAYGWNRTLNDVDATLLAKVRTSICREWSAAAKITMEQANIEVEALLQSGRRSHQP